MEKKVDLTRTTTILKDFATAVFIFLLMAVISAAIIMNTEATLMPSWTMCLVGSFIVGWFFTGLPKYNWLVWLPSFATLAYLLLLTIAGTFIYYDESLTFNIWKAMALLFSISAASFLGSVIGFLQITAVALLYIKYLEPFLKENGNAPVPSCSGAPKCETGCGKDAASGYKYCSECMSSGAWKAHEDVVAKGTGTGFSPAVVDEDEIISPEDDDAIRCECGSIMVRDGAQFKCVNCGKTKSAEVSHDSMINLVGEVVLGEEATHADKD